MKITFFLISKSKIRSDSNVAGMKILHKYCLYKFFGIHSGYFFCKRTFQEAIHFPL